MIWQDIIIAIMSIVFSISLIPQIYCGFKEKTGPIKFQTSIPTFIGCYVIVFTYWTLSLFFSSVITFITGTMWLILFIQRIMYKK